MFFIGNCTKVKYLSQGMCAWRIKEIYSIIQYILFIKPFYISRNYDLVIFKMRFQCADKLTWMLTVTLTFDSVATKVLTSVLILYPLKTPEKFWFFDVFRGCKMWTLVRYGLIRQIRLMQDHHRQQIWNSSKLDCQIVIVNENVRKRKHYRIYSYQSWQIISGHQVLKG